MAAPPPPRRLLVRHPHATASTRLRSSLDPQIHIATGSSIYARTSIRVSAGTSAGIAWRTMKASSLSFQSAVLFVIAGMIWGIVMAVSEDHSAMPARAHLNLLGWVSLFLFGIFYRLNPTVESNRLALPQVWIWIVSTIVLAIGVGLVHTGHPIGDPIAAVGSIAIFADAILFTWLVFQVRPTDDQASRVAVRLN